ncbi:MAG: DNA polymerase III subunit beta, partial [Synergistaceae bacterium]|nr:DNA polymerase III subunit beta [Synergistaceae bacterium]
NDTVKTSMKISSGELSSVLERIDIIARTTPAHIMSMTLNPDGGVKITARAPERGTASESLTAEISGEFMQIGFNVAYFLEGLKVLGPGEIFIEFSDEEGQSRMKRAESDSLLYMLMPARLGPQDKIAEDEMIEF